MIPAVSRTQDQSVHLRTVRIQTSPRLPVDERRDRERERDREADEARVQRHRVDPLAVVLEQRVQALAVGRGDRRASRRGSTERHQEREEREDDGQ